MADEESLRVERENFKHRQLRQTVMDECWETNLTWADAQTDLPSHDPAQIDTVVRDVLLELFDDGLVVFMEITDLGASYARAANPSEALSRDEVAEALVSTGDSYPMLAIRATCRGREYHFRRVPEDRDR